MQGDITRLVAVLAPSDEVRGVTSAVTLVLTLPNWVSLGAVSVGVSGVASTDSAQLATAGKLTPEKKAILRLK